MDALEHHGEPWQQEAFLKPILAGFNGPIPIVVDVNGDRQAALQCLLLDPVVTDLDVAQQILDDYLETYQEYLPQFW